MNEEKEDEEQKSLKGGEEQKNDDTRGPQKMALESLELLTVP